MKFLLVIAALASVAVAGPTRALVVPGGAGPAPVVDEDGNPVTIDEYHPVHVGPAIVDDFHGIDVGPAMIDDFHPIDVDMPIIDFPVGADGAVVSPAGTPLVQIIVNVKNQTPGANPVQVVDGTEVAPTPVEVVDEAVNDYEPVLVMDPFPVAPEPVVVAPIVVEPAVVAPEILN